MNHLEGMEAVSHFPVLQNSNQEWLRRHGGSQALFARHKVNWNIPPLQQCLKFGEATCFGFDFFPSSFSDFYIIQAFSSLPIGICNSNPTSQECSICLGSDINLATTSRVLMPKWHSGHMHKSLVCQLALFFFRSLRKLMISLMVIV